MKELKNMVIVEETITTGYTNEHGKVVATSIKKRKALGKEFAEKRAKTDETLEIIGPAFEVIRAINGKKIRQVLSLEDAEVIEVVAEKKEEIKLPENKAEKTDENQVIKKEKPGPKPKKVEEKKEESEEGKENQ